MADTFDPVETTMSETLRVLVGARRLIENPETWTTGATARGPNSRVTSATDPTAIRFCAYGALVRAHGKYQWDQPGYQELAWAAGYPDPIRFNDLHSHAEVLAAFDRAIKREEVKADRAGAAP